MGKPTVAGRRGMKKGWAKPQTQCHPSTQSFRFAEVRTAALSKGVLGHQGKVLIGQLQGGGFGGLKRHFNPPRFVTRNLSRQWNLEAGSAGACSPLGLQSREIGDDKGARLFMEKCLYLWVLVQ